jgi:hypothetical protein
VRTLRAVNGSRWYPMLVVAALLVGFAGSGLFFVASQPGAAPAGGSAGAGGVAPILAALVAAAAAIWVGFRTQGVTTRVARESRESQERLARDQQEHQLLLAREQQAFQERQAQRELEHERLMAEQAQAHQERLARNAQAAQLALAQYNAGRARRERRIDPLLEHATTQTMNMTRLLQAFDSGDRSGAAALIQVITKEMHDFQQASPGLVRDPRLFGPVMAYGAAETALRDLAADRFGGLVQGRPLPRDERLQAAWVELIRRSTVLEEAIEQYIASPTAPVGSDNVGQ